MSTAYLARWDVSIEEDDPYPIHLIIHHQILQYKNILQMHYIYLIERFVDNDLIKYALTHYGQYKLVYGLMKNVIDKDKVIIIMVLVRIQTML